MPSHPQTRVLYVDHHDDSREMLCTLLAISQIDVTAVASAKNAVSLMESERFDMYLLESWLPVTDGFELCRILRERHPETPVVFFSGAAFEENNRCFGVTLAEDPAQFKTIRYGKPGLEQIHVKPF